VIPFLLVAFSLAHAEPKTVTRADSGKTVTIAPHQLLRIKLDECRGSCGYTWKPTIKPDPAVLKRRRTIRWEQACPPQPQPCPVGRPETVTFRYVGKAAGRTKLRLGYFGPGKDRPSEDSFRLTVRVR
jgi:hypothetical protein